MSSSSSTQFWSAPSAVSKLSQFGGSSSWSCVRVAVPSRRQWAAVPLNHEPAAFAGIRLARTRGRALRNTRRFLRRNPVVFE